MKSVLPKSFRRRLPLSYAGIAMLTALALGTVLLITLRGFYARQERVYLERNAEAIGEVLARLVQIDLPSEALRSQLNTFSFLTLTRVRLLDAHGSVQADSGDPLLPRGVSTIALQVQIDQATQSYSRTVEGAGEERGFTSLIAIQDANAGLTLSQSTFLKGIQPEPEAFVQSFVAPIGSGLTDIIGLGGERSAIVVRTPVRDISGSVTGHVELSEGPAYGRVIMRSVAWGWGIAGAISVLLSGLVGWRVSRGLSRPLEALTETTERMAAGDLGARAVVSPMRELGVLARSFNRMAERVEHTVATLRRFVADAAHALNTPLTALHTNLELVSASPGSDGQRQLVQEAQVQLERLVATTRSLLHLSRIEAGWEQTQDDYVDLGQLARAVCEPFASRAERGGLAFELLLPSQPVVVRGWAAQLGQALDNLLDNGVKFTPAGGAVRVKVSAEGKEAFVQVEDTGIGIPSADLPHLYERFYRGGNASTFPGSGLGLAIVKAIVERHGGRVTTLSDMSGTAVSIVLPLVEAQTEI